MTRGVKRGMISKRDVLRAWVSKKGEQPFELSEAKEQYDSISAADGRYTLAEVRRVVSETHDELVDGRWLRRGSLPEPEELGSRDASLRDVGSWDHPVLVAAIDTLNYVMGAGPWDPQHVEVDFRNPGWMRIYMGAVAELCPGDEAGPLDCAIHILSKIVNERAS